MWERVVALYGISILSYLRKQCVAENSAETASKEIHETKATRQRRGIPCIHLEVDAKVRGELIVHRKLRSEASAVLNDHDHHLQRHESERSRVLPTPHPPKSFLATFLLPNSAVSISAD